MSAPAAITSPQQLERGTSLGRDAWRRLLKNKLAVICSALLAIIILICLVGPMCSPYSPDQDDLSLGASGPSWSHWLGTDTLGRDLFTRIMHGGRISLAVGAAATLVSVLIGVAYGAIAAYAGGKVDSAMMRTVDVLYGIPFIIFVILIKVMFSSEDLSAWKKLMILFLAIGAVEWLTMSRIVRGQVEAIKRMEFVEAARSLGLSAGTIIWRHIIPNIMGPVIVYATLTVPSVMLTEAALSFLGLGVEPPQSSWGVLIENGASAMESYPWLLIFPGLFFVVTLFSLNFAGDGLRDALDVRAAKD